jgi:hypothetical protein
MVFIAIAALNFGAIRALLNLRSPLNNKTVGLLGLGALPMVNFLAAAALVSRWRHGPRTFLRGIEASGAAALALYFAGACFFTEPFLMPYLYLAIGPVAGTIAQNWPIVHITIFYCIAVVMLALPQMTIALIGGFLFWKFTTRRMTGPNSPTIGH